MSREACPRTESVDALRHVVLHVPSVCPARPQPPMQTHWLNMRILYAGSLRAAFGQKRRWDIYLTLNLEFFDRLPIYFSQAGAYQLVVVIVTPCHSANLHILHYPNVLTLFRTNICTAKCFSLQQLKAKALAKQAHQCVGSCFFFCCCCFSFKRMNKCTAIGM